MNIFYNFNLKPKRQLQKSKFGSKLSVKSLRINFKLIFFTLFFTYSLLTYSEQMMTGTVIVNKLNVRVKPNVKYTRISSLKKGDKVTIIRIEKDWVEIIAPKSSIVWVSKKFITGNMTNQKIKLRSGPGIAFSSYSILPGNEKIIVLDNTQKDWVRIQPPPTLTAWTAVKYIKIDEVKVINPIVKLVVEQKPVEIKIVEDNNYLSKDEIIKLSNASDDKVNTDSEILSPIRKEVADEKFIENTMIVNIATEALDEIVDGEKVKPKTIIETESNAELELLDLPFLGKSVISAYPGIILPLNAGANYVTHALVTKLDGEYFPIAYLHSKNINLSEWERKGVVVKGIECRVKNWKRPVIEVEEIRLFKAGK